MRRATRSSLLVTSILSAALAVGAVPAAAQSPTPIDQQAVIEALTAPDTSVHFVGVSSDPNVYVAVVNDEGAISIYLCDGAEIAVWLTGEMVDGSLTATGADGSTATATQDGEAIAGTVTLADGSTLDFSVTPAVPPAGLYERVFVHNGEPTQSRTIQLADGTAKGNAKAVKCDELSSGYFKMLEMSAATSNPVTERTANRLASNFLNKGLDAGCAWADAVIS